jgi:hypothetical protein
MDGPRRRRWIGDRDDNRLAGARVEDSEGHRTHPSSIYKVQLIALRHPQQT